MALNYLSVLIYKAWSWR